MHGQNPVDFVKRPCEREAVWWVNHGLRTYQSRSRSFEEEDEIAVFLISIPDSDGPF